MKGKKQFLIVAQIRESGNFVYDIVKSSNLREAWSLFKLTNAKLHISYLFIRASTSNRSYFKLY